MSGDGMESNARLRDELEKLQAKADRYEAALKEITKTVISFEMSAIAKEALDATES